MKITVLVAVFINLIFSGQALASDQKTVFGYYLNSVSGGNMLPTLEHGERIYSDPDYYNENRLKRGDVILFRSKQTGHQLWVSRVIGLPGETISFREGIIYIDDTLLTENYVKNENNRHAGDFPSVNIPIPPNGVFLMGDNRDNSKDSRYIGFVKISDIEAKVAGIYLSTRLGHIGSLDDVAYSERQAD